MNIGFNNLLYMYTWKFGIRPFVILNHSSIILFKIIKTNTQYQKRIHLDFVADDFVVIFMSNTHS